MPLALAILLAAAEPRAVYEQIARNHAEAVERLRQWLAVPAIAAQQRNLEPGAHKLMSLLEDAGFQHVERVPTEGVPGVFATLDAGAKKSVGIYFMYDVKQFEPAEWSAPPLEGRIVDRPGLGKVMIGRGVDNQLGPEAAFLAALHAFKSAGQKLPVNLVLVAEGEEEIGSPHFAQIVRRPDIAAALSKTIGVFMPAADQDEDGTVSIVLGAKGVLELELVAHGENAARRMVQALATMVDASGEPAIDGFTDKARPLSAKERAMVENDARNESEELAKRQTSGLRWSHDANWPQSLIEWVERPTVNLQGMLAQESHRAVAKLDFRLVPDMTYAGSIAALKAHLARRGFGDLEMQVTGGYDPCSTSPDSPFIRKQVATYRRYGIEAPLWPRNPGSFPGWVFTGAPLHLPMNHFGLGVGGGAHMPDEFLLIDSANPKVQGFDGATRSYVDYLFELAK